MDLILKREEVGPNGAFSTLHTTSGEQLFYTVEHAYPVMDTWVEKIIPGTYTCQRGMHRLEGMTEDFETFEIEKVPGHTDILFHVGNTAADSHGCVCLGLYRTQLNGVPAVALSKLAFQKFMLMQQGVESFELTVA